jgi:LmbE family N-acetylglucosaminyl deacetylase
VWATFGERSNSSYAHHRRSEAMRVAMDLGATGIGLGLPDGRIERGAFTESADSLVKTVQPHLVIWPCGTGPEQHQDHNVVHDSMVNIAGRSNDAATCWCIGQPPVDRDAFFHRPQLYLGFDEPTLGRIQNLMATYTSERRKHFADPRFLRSRAEQWAFEARAGVPFAEPYMLLKGMPPQEFFSRVSVVYFSADGKLPVQAFFDELPAVDRNIATSLIDDVRIRGMQALREAGTTDGFYDLQTETPKGRLHLPCFIDPNGRVVIADALFSTERVLSPEMIRTAQSRRTEWFAAVDALLRTEQSIPEGAPMGSSQPYSPAQA